MAYIKPLQHETNSPYSGNVPIIEYKDLENLRKSNSDLKLKLEQAKQAPEFNRDVFKELENAETRVQELEKHLRESYYDDKHNEAMADQLRKTNKKIAELTDELDEANRQNSNLDRQLTSKAEMEDKLNEVVKNIEEMKRKLDAAQVESKNLETDLREARSKQGELRSAKEKLKNMEYELNGANRKLARLEQALVSANERWKAPPSDLTRIYVNPGTSGRVVRSSYDGYGRKIKGSEKVMEIADNRSNSQLQRDIDHRLSGFNDRALELRMGQLKGQYLQNERENADLMRENGRLAAEVRIMKEAYDKLQQLNESGNSKVVVKDMRSRVV